MRSIASYAGLEGAVTPTRIDFQTEPAAIAMEARLRRRRGRLILDVDENAGLFEGYELKLNSYDLTVDIELYDAVQRLRFEHPEVKVVVVTGGSTGCSAPAPTSRCSPARATVTR